jgi:hypothetical protein
MPGAGHGLDSRAESPPHEILEPAKGSLDALNALLVSPRAGQDSTNVPAK